MSGWSVFPDCAFHGGQLWDCYREDPTIAGRLVVRRDGVEHLAIDLPAGSPCFPKLHSFDGVLWIGYHDGTFGHLLRLDPPGLERLLDPCESNDPITFGSRWVAWQGARYNAWPISRMDLETGEIAPAGFGQGTSLSRVLPDGTVRTIDQDRVVVPGATRPCWAGDLVVAEGRDAGIVWHLTDGRAGVLWPGVSSWTPRCAVDPDSDRVAVVTWGAQTDTRLWVGSRAELPAAPAEPIVAIGRPMWGGWFVFGPVPGDLTGNCYAQCGPIGAQASEVLLYSMERRLFAQYVAAEQAGQDIEEEIAKARIRHPDLPVIAYWTRQDFNDDTVPSADFVGVEAYRGAAETATVFEAKIRAAVAPCPKAMLIPQRYTSNTGNTTDLASIPPVVARIAHDLPNVVGLLTFSGAGRATGYQDHPEIHTAWADLFAGIPSAPSIPVPTPVPEPPAPAPVPQPTPHPEPPMPTTIPPISDDEIIELVTLYHSCPPQAGKDDDAYLRDAAYYGCGYMRWRAFGDSHADAAARYQAAAQFDLWYEPSPPGMMPDPEIIDLRARWTARYREIGRYQRQSRFENARDLTYWLIVYARAREVGRSHEAALRAMERGMNAEAGLPDPYAGEPGGGGTISRLAIAGRFFRMDGQPFTIIESSEFSLFKRFLDAEPLVTDVLRERQALGFNCLRVWLLNQSVIGGRNGGFDGSMIHPNQYPDFYDRLGPFVDLCGGYGMVVELTVFTSTGSLMPNAGDQQAHLERTAHAVRGKGNVLLELANEIDQYDNAPAPDLTRPSGVLISRGSNGADSMPPEHGSPWDYELYHTNGLDEFQRKVGHNAMEWADQSGKPCISNENTRYPDQDASTTHAYDAAMGAALLCAGSCYHSQGGKFSRLFDATELECARGWVAGARSVPLEFQRGFYTHRTDVEGADCIRGYSRTLGDGREYIIKIRP